MLNSKIFVTNLVKLAPFNVAQGIMKSTGKYSAAAVACIIRVDNVSQRQNIAFSSLMELQSSSFLNDHISDDNVSIFFIKRAIRERDAWSGHIAFPGGYLNEDESDLDAVKREVMEEVGVDLNHPHVHWLGRLTTKSFGKSNEKTIIPHAFLCLSGENVACPFDTMELNKTEVEAVKWVDMRHFLDTQPAKFTLPTRTMRPKYWELTHSFLALMRLDKLYFPCFRLGGAVISAPGVTVPPGDGGNEPWLLWGMTYSFVCDLLNTPLVAVEGAGAPSTVADAGQGHGRVPARTMHTDTHADTHSRMSRRMFRDVVFAQVDNPVFNFFLNFFHRRLRKTELEQHAMASNTKRVVAYAVASALCVHAVIVGGTVYLSSYFLGI
jgi:8-oxo-dGTP pyrophosphatase MutT (NUDIX family)